MTFSMRRSQVMASGGLSGARTAVLQPEGRERYELDSGLNSVYGAERLVTRRRWILSLTYGSEVLTASPPQEHMCDSELGGAR